MSVYSGVSFNGISLNITSIRPTKQQKTRKSIIGKTLVETSVIGLNAQQWVLNLSGVVTGTTSANLGTNRGLIEGLDIASVCAYIDGIHNGDFVIVPGSLTFEDEEDNAGVGSHYRFSMTIVEE